LIVGFPAAIVVHEAGHFLACRILKVRVTAVYLGTGKSAALRFSVGGVKFSLGWPVGGRVEHVGTKSVRKSVLITAAGALANLIAALVLLDIGWSGDWRRVLAALAVIMAGTGLGSLMPFRSRSGRFSDGARLFAQLFGGPFAVALLPAAPLASRTRRNWPRR
jgi:membrane-associated protease RseP (regulator of RpoE activity)